MKTEPLQQLGLTKSEIRVYICLLDMNSASASEIADETDMYRKNVYDALYALMKKGLVSFSKTEQRKIFTAASPQRLLQLIEVQKNEVQSVLHHLKTIYDAAPMKEDITVFKGKEGLKTIFEDIITQQLPNNAFGTGEEFRSLLPYYFTQFQKRKAEKAIRSRVVCPERERGSSFATQFVGDIRFLPHDTTTTTIIYGNKVAIITWKENPTGIFISSAQLAKSYGNYFESLWKIATR